MDGWMDALECQILYSVCGVKTGEISYCFLCCHGHDGTLSRSLDHGYVSMGVTATYMLIFIIF